MIVMCLKKAMIIINKQMNILAPTEAQGVTMARYARSPPTQD